MRRRALLASLAAGSASLAGCALLGDGDAETPTNTPAAGSPSPSPTPTATEESVTSKREPFEAPADPRTVIDFETAPRTYSLQNPPWLGVDADLSWWFDRTATANHPARLRGYLENTASTEVSVPIGVVPVVGATEATQRSGDPGDATLYMAPTANNAIATEVPEVRRNDDGHWVVTDVGEWITDNQRLAPGARVPLEYVLVGHPDSSGQPLGTFQFTGNESRTILYVGDSGHPGPDGESRFAGTAVPPIDDEETTAWYHEADSETVCYLEPSTEQAELDAEIDFEVVNYGHEVVECGHWDLYKLVEGEWYPVRPIIHAAYCAELLPGARKEWTLRAFNGSAVDCDSCDEDAPNSVVLTEGYLGGGQYAMAVGFSAPEDQSAALVELQGPPAEIAPSGQATVEADGDTVVMTYENQNYENMPDGALTLERTDSAENRILPEQLMGRDDGAIYGPLRDALAMMDDDVERVVARADASFVHHPISHDEDVRRFRFRGQAYAARRGEPNE